MYVTVFLFFFTFVGVTSGENVKCDMIPIETDEGLMGYCCVFNKNSSMTVVNSSETVKILEDFISIKNKKGSTTRPPPRSQGRNKIRFPDNNESIENNVGGILKNKPQRNRTVYSTTNTTTHKTQLYQNNTIKFESNADRIVYPEHNEPEKFGKGDERNSSEREDTLKEYPNAGNKTTGGKVNKITIDGRNKDDVPETCTDGMEQDVNGDCVEVF